MSSLNYFLMATVLTVTMLFLAYTNYLVMDNISLVSQSSHIFVCGVVAITAIATTSYERKKIADFHDFFVNPYICEYSRNDYFEGLKVVTQKKKKYYVIVFTAVYGACGVVSVDSQAILTFGWLSSDHTPSIRPWCGHPPPGDRTSNNTQNQTQYGWGRTTAVIE